MIKTILTTAAIATIGLTGIEAGFAAPSEARGGCYPSLAGDTMNTALAGGASVATAWKWAIDDGYATDTQRCWTLVRGWARQVPYSLSHLYRAVW